MPTPSPTIDATVGAEVLTSIVAASSVMPELPAAEAGDRHADGQARRRRRSRRR